MQELEAKSSCQSNHNKVGLISINFIWFSINFSKPGMKNIKARRNGIVAAGSNGTVMNSAEAKFRYAGNFAIIAKFRYVAKILFVAKCSASCFCVQMTPFWLISFLPL